MKTMSRYISILALLFTISSATQSEIVSEEILLMNDSIQLPGTLSYNKNLEKQPLVIYIHGSGNIDRNGNQASQVGANYIKQLSEALNRSDIAFYRYDKRTSNMANMKFLMQGITFDDFVEDVKVAINNFKDDNRFSGITLIGHSQGSLIAMLALSDAIDKYISLAGPATRIDKTMIEQIRKQNGDSIADIVASHFKELKSTGKIETIDPNLMALFNPQNQPFFTSWMMYNPTEEIKKVTIPTLVINGTKDLQVFEADAKALHEAQPNSELKLINNMNHLLKTITKEEDNLKSYGSPDFPLSEELVTILTSFIKK